MFNEKERHALYTSTEEREREIDVTLHNTNTIRIGTDTLIIHCFIHNCHDENKVKDTLLYNDIFRSIK